MKKIKELKRRLVELSAFSTVLMSSTISSAANIKKFNVNKNVNADNVTSGMISAIISGAQSLGVVVVIGSVVAWIVANAEDNALDKNKALKAGVFGAMLFAIPTILKVAGLIS